MHFSKLVVLFAATVAPGLAGIIYRRGEQSGSKSHQISNEDGNVHLNIPPVKRTDWYQISDANGGVYSTLRPTHEKRDEWVKIADTDDGVFYAKAPQEQASNTDA